MLIGFITKVHEDLSGFVKSTRGDRYRFYADGLWGFEEAPPKEGEGVIWELNSTQRTAKALRRVGKQKVVAVPATRWVAAIVKSRGVAANRFASAIYLPIASSEANLTRTDEAVLVRMSYDATQPNVVQAVEVQALPSDRASALAQALQCDEAMAAEKLQELDHQASTFGRIEEEAQLVGLIELLQLRDAYTAVHLGKVVEASPQWALELRRRGYGGQLTISSLVQALATDSTFSPSLLAPALLSQFVPLRLLELGSIMSLKTCEEVLSLYKLCKLKNASAFTAGLLVEMPIASEHQVELWLQGLPVPSPSLPVFVGMLLAKIKKKEQQGLQAVLEGCRRENILLEACREALAQTADDKLQAVLPILSAAVDSAQRDELLAAVKHRIPEDQLVAWWEQGIISSIPASLVAVKIINYGLTYFESQREKYCLLAGATEALAHEIEKALLTGRSVAALFELLRYVQGYRKPIPKPKRQWGYSAYQPQPYESHEYRRWASSAMPALRLPSRQLPAVKQLQWWLDGIGAQPDTSALSGLMPGMTPEYLERAWDSISEEALPVLLESLRGWLERELPIEWLELALRQLRGRGGSVAPLAWKLLQDITSLLPAAKQLELWQSNLIGQPAQELIVARLNSASSEESVRMLMALELESLPTILPSIFNILPADRRLTEHALKRLAGEHEEDSAIYRLKADLLRHLFPKLSPEQYTKWWLEGLLPDPTVEAIAEAVQHSNSERRWELLSHCSSTLLLDYCRLLQSEAVSGLQAKASIRDCAVLLTQMLAKHAEARPLLTELLARVENAEQLSWWGDGADIQIDWQVIEEGLADNAIQEWVVQAAVKNRLEELTHYLPHAPAFRIPHLVMAMTDTALMGPRAAMEQVAALVALGVVVCRKHSHEQPMLSSWLMRLRERCLSHQLLTAYRELATISGEQYKSIEQAVADFIAPGLTPSELLDYWQKGLLDYFPLAPLEDIARLAVSSTAYQRQGLSLAANIPESVIRAWHLLAALPGNTSAQAQQTIRASAAAWDHRELLRGINPWLLERLSEEQRAWAWMSGHPMTAPDDWAQLILEDRIKTSVLYEEKSLQHELPEGFTPSIDEISEWLALQYWEEEDQAQVARIHGMLKQYHEVNQERTPFWDTTEDELLLRCAAVVKVRLWLSCPEVNRERTFNYYGFRRGFSRLKTREQSMFLSQASTYLKTSFRRALHQRRRRLVREEDGISVYRVSLAHCYCPQASYLEVELADKTHTQPFAYPDAEPGWNEKLIKEPWAACPVLVHVDERSRELLRIQGLDAALLHYPLDRADAIETFRPVRHARGTTNNPVSYPEDEVLRDELSEYLAQLAGGGTQKAFILEEARVQREYSDAASTSSYEQPEAESPDAEQVEGALIQPRQTVLYPVVLQDEVAFVWTGRFANSNRATYLFRVPAQEQSEALERLTACLQLVGNIRSALLAPGVASHRLRCHLGYACTIRSRRGQAQAFERWQARFDQALSEGPSRKHPYDAHSDWQMSELTLEGQQTHKAAPSTGSAASTAPVGEEPIARPPAPVPDPVQLAVFRRASHLLKQLLALNQAFLSEYAA